MTKLGPWFVHSTLSIALLCIVSIILGMGEWGVVSNIFIGLLMALGIIFSRGEKLANVWTHMCLATLFTAGAAVTGISLGVAIMRPEGVGTPEWRFISSFFTALVLSGAILGIALFASVVAKELKMKFEKTFSFFTIQGVALYLFFRYMFPIVSKFFGA